MYKEEMFRGCIKPEDTDVGTFHACTEVGASGAVEDLRIDWSIPALTSLSDKLHALPQQHAAVFPPPPHDHSWLRLYLDWGEFTPLTAK
jgi:hypothetical protein